MSSTSLAPAPRSEPVGRPPLDPARRSPRLRGAHRGPAPAVEGPAPPVAVRRIPLAWASLCSASLASIALVLSFRVEGEIHRHLLLSISIVLFLLTLRGPGGKIDRVET